jgi:hypothetical protein
MIIKADEIQKLCKYNKGDWFWNGEKPYLYCKSGLGSSNPYDYKWLPTLEDLFGILGNKEFPDNKANEKYIDFTFVYIGNFTDDIENIYEKLLCWIMSIYYNKSWNPNNKEWEAIE